MIFIDLSNFRCPLPLVKTKLALNKLTEGEQLEVLISDRSSIQDVPNYLTKKGYLVVQTQEANGNLRLLITNTKTGKSC